MERDGTIDFEDLQWTPPSSPQHEEGVTLQLPSLDRAEEISSIFLECSPIATTPLQTTRTKFRLSLRRKNCKHPTLAPGIPLSGTSTATL